MPDEQRLWKSLWAVSGSNVADSSEGRAKRILSRSRSEPRLQTAKQTVKSQAGANSALSLLPLECTGSEIEWFTVICRRKLAGRRSAVNVDNMI